MEAHNPKRRGSAPDASGAAGASGGPGGASLRPATAAWLAAAAALAGSALELAGLGYLTYAEDRFLFVGHQVVWLVPAFLLLFVGSIAALSWAAGRWWRRLRQPGTHLGIVAAASLLSPMLVFQPRLHPAAGALLAIGLGIQIGRWGSRRSWAVAGGPRRVSLVLTVVLLAASLTTASLERGSRLADRDAPPAPPSLPSVLLIVLDTVRAADLSLYGYHLPTTPFLEELGRRGVVFENAIAPTSWTLPTHATIFTGRWPNALAADWQSPLRLRRETLAEFFRARGYRTGGFVGNLTYVSRETGLAQGFETYEDRRLKPDELVHAAAVGRFVYNAPRFRSLFGSRWPVTRNDATELRERVLRWIDAGPADQPFFGFVNLFDAHLPYQPDPDLLGRFGPVRPPTWKTRVRRFLAGQGPLSGLDSAMIRRMRARYDEAIATIDRELGTLVESLAQRGRLERTVIVVVGDHGELFGEGRQIGHGADLQINTLRVPLLLAGPGVAAGVRVPGLVSLRDLAETLVDVTGLPGDDFRGYSLRPLWEGRPGATVSPTLAMISAIQDDRPLAPGRRPAIPIRRGNVASRVVDSLQLVVNTDGTTELFRLHDEAPWATAVPLASLPSDSLGRLVDGLWRLWGGRSSAVGALRGAEVTLTRIDEPPAGTRLASRLRVPAPGCLEPRSPPPPGAPTLAPCPVR